MQEGKCLHFWKTQIFENIQMCGRRQMLTLRRECFAPEPPSRPLASTPDRTKMFQTKKCILKNIACLGISKCCVLNVKMLK